MCLFSWCSVISEMFMLKLSSIYNLRMSFSSGCVYSNSDIPAGVDACCASTTVVSCVLKTRCLTCLGYIKRNFFALITKKERKIASRLDALYVFFDNRTRRSCLVLARHPWLVADAFSKVPDEPPRRKPRRSCENVQAGVRSTTRG